MGLITGIYGMVRQAQQDELEKQKMEVQMESYRRTQNRIAEKEGMARAIADKLNESFGGIESAQRDFDSVQKQWFEASQRGMLSPQMNDQYRNAFATAKSNLELEKSKYRVLTMQKAHMDGTLDKSIAKSTEPMLGDIFSPKKDPYDQITEERTTKRSDTVSGIEEVVTQKGPARAFQGQSAYMPQGDDAEVAYTPPATPANLLGFTPAGFEEDQEAVTPEIASPVPVPASPTPMQSSDEKTMAMNAYNKAQTPQAKEKIRQAAAARGIQIP